MGKNNKLINSLAEIARRNREQNVMAASERDTPQIYSAIAIALWKTLDMPDSEKPDAINSIFVESQRIWEECIEKNCNIEELCEDVTGICIKGGHQDETR